MQTTSAPQNTAEEPLQSVLTEILGGAVLTLATAPDRLKLFLKCVRDPNAELTLTFDDLLRFVTRVAPRKLIHDDILKDALQRLAAEPEVPFRRVAKGEAPQPGTDGKLVLMVKPYAAEATSEEHLGRHFRRRFDNIEPGIAVARLYHPTPGVPGIDVLGNEIATVPGKPLPLKLDPSLREESGSGHAAFSSIIAAGYGYLEQHEQELKVQERWVLRGDVDLTGGDIDFSGSMVIEGSVRKDAFVSARGDVVINGDVESGWVSSRAGSIEVKGIVLGDRNAMQVSSNVSLGMLERMRHRRQGPQLRAAGKVKVRAVEAASIEAGTDIEVEREVRSSVLRTHGSLTLAKARLIGGDSFIVTGMEVDTAGTPAGVKTSIHIAAEAEAGSDFQALAKQLSAHLHAEELMRLSLGPLADAPEVQLRALPEKQRAKIADLRRKLAQVKESRKALHDAIAALKGSATGPETIEVRFRTALHAGVEISSGEQRFSIEDRVSGPGVVVYDGQTQTFSRKP